jgi:hypothetical protein
MLPLNCLFSCVIEKLITFKALSKGDPFNNSNYNVAVDIVNRAGIPRD